MHLRTANLCGAGTYAVDFLPKLLTACHQLGATQGILTDGRVDFNRMTTRTKSHLGLDGIRDVSPQPHEIQLAFGTAGKDQIAEATRDAWEPLARALIERVITAQYRAGLVSSQCVWAQGLGTGHTRPTELMVRELKHSLPTLHLVACGVIPEDADKLDERVLAGHGLFHQLWEEGIIETFLLTDNSSPFAHKHTLAVADRFAATALASLLAAPLQFPKNRGLVEVGISLGDFGPFTGLSFAAKSLAVAKQPVWYGLPQRAWGWVPKGTVDLRSVVIKAEEALTECLQSTEARALEETLDPDKPFFAVFTIPLPIGEAWSELTNQLRSRLTREYPTGVPIFVSGGGTPDPRYPGSYWLQCSLLFPLPLLPAPIAALIGRPTGKVPRGRAAGKPTIPPHPSLDTGASLTQPAPAFVQPSPNTHPAE